MLINNSIINNQTITSSGSYLYNVDTSRETILFWNITGTITGTSPTIQFTLQEVDPSDQISSVGKTINSSVITATGVGNIILSMGISPLLLVTWTVGGTSPSFSGANLVITSRDVGSTINVMQSTSSSLTATVVGTGTDNMANSTAKLPTLPAVANTSAPSWTNGNMVPLSTDTAGNLRVTGTFTSSGAADTTGTSSLNTLNATVQVAMAGNNNAGMQLVAGTLIGTIVSEVSLDGGTTWIATYFSDPATGNKVSSIIFGSSNTTTAKSIVGAGGASHVRVRVSAYTSGSATCNLRASIMLDPSTLYDGAPGSASAPALIQIGGLVTTSAPSYSNATMNALSINTSGALRIDGSSVTQPVSGTVTVQQVTAANLNATVTGTVAVTQNTSPWVSNITQFGSSNVVTGIGVSGAGIPRITISNDSNILATQSGTWTVTATQATAANLRAQTASEFTTATTTGTIASLVGGAVTTTAPTYTTGQMDSLSLTTAGALRIDGSSVTQPVSGTVTANQGAPNTIANKWPVQVTDGTNVMPTADVAARAQFDKITDGTNTAAVKAASTTAVAADPALVVAVSPNNTVAVTQSTSPWVTNISQIGGNNVTTLVAGEQKVAVEGLTAPGAAVSGNPVYAGGKNPSGNAIGIITDAVGSVIASAGGNEFPIHVNATITTSGSQIIAANDFGAQQINLIVNVKSAPTGTTPTIQFTVQELDTGDNATTFGNSSKTILITGMGVYTTSLFYSTSNAINVAWTVTGTTPSFTGVYSTVVTKVTPTTLPAYSGAASQSGTAATGISIAVASTENIMRLLTYTQQSTNAQRSVVSGSANDASAGTGARQVTITYYDQNMQGPFTETVTLNGTTAVNTVGTNICFLEKMEIISVGTGGKNAGFISLLAGTGGAGATMGQIAIGANVTKYAHHYIAAGKTCYIEHLTMSVAGTTAVGGVQYMKWSNPTVATSPVVIIGDTLRAWTNTTSVSREYNPPLKIVGPALVAVYNVSDSSTAATYYASLDYYDQ